MLWATQPSVVFVLSLTVQFNVVIFRRKCHQVIFPRHVTSRRHPIYLPRACQPRPIDVLGTAFHLRT